MKKIYIYSNNDSLSLSTKQELIKLLKDNNINILEKYSFDCEMVIVIGGDGTFLNAIKEANYSNVPILGVNTGHLGFFAEFLPNELNEVVDICVNHNYLLQSYNTLKAVITDNENNETNCLALNDIFVKHGKSSIVHLDLSIGDNHIESFSGDGLLMSSSAGSTAYNYSLGGSIVDSRMNIIQITPVAPTNNVVYRCFTSSLLVPEDEIITIIPKDDDSVIVIDGNELDTKHAKKVVIISCKEKINIIRRSSYSFWSKVKSKFI